MMQSKEEGPRREALIQRARLELERVDRVACDYVC
jgi:hypothetical protein